MSHYEEKLGAASARGPEPNEADHERVQDGPLSAFDAAIDPTALRRALLVYGTAGQAARVGAQARMQGV